MLILRTFIDLNASHCVYTEAKVDRTSDSIYCYINKNILAPVKSLLKLSTWSR